MDTIEPLPIVPADRLRQQIESILVAWGMDKKKIYIKL